MTKKLVSRKSIALKKRLNPGGEPAFVNSGNGIVLIFPNLLILFELFRQKGLALQLFLEQLPPGPLKQP